MSQWTSRTAEDPRLKVAARIGTIVLMIFAAPAASWSVLSIINHGERLTAIETTIKQSGAAPYSSLDASRDLALRDAMIARDAENIVRLQSAVADLARIIADFGHIQAERGPRFHEFQRQIEDVQRRLGVIEEKQNSRVPLFDQMREDMRELKARVYGPPPPIGPPR